MYEHLQGIEPTTSTSESYRHSYLTKNADLSSFALLIQSIISSINPSKINNKQQPSPSKIEIPSRNPTNTPLDSQKNSNNKIQSFPDPEPSAATKRTLADRSPPFLPIDIDRYPTGKPKHNMDIANITNPTSTTTTLTSEPDFHFGPATAPTASALSLNGPLDFGILPAKVNALHTWKL
ncbi:hypothetical protein G6F24_015046 [Rhizopus arrhizus]|nr:hypothetical protein G6F24_015046 [Rhizopus arrhizus]